ARAGGGARRFGDGARLRALSSDRRDPAQRDTVRVEPSGRTDRPDPTGPGGVGRGGGDGLGAALSWAAVWRLPPRWQGRGGAGHPGRGTGSRAGHGTTPGGGGAVSPPGELRAPAADGSARRGRDLVDAGLGCGPTPGGKIARVAGRHESGSALAPERE